MKTVALKAKLAKLGAENALIIGGAEIDSHVVRRAASNIPLLSMFCRNKALTFMIFCAVIRACIDKGR